MNCLVLCFLLFMNCSKKASQKENKIRVSKIDITHSDKENLLKELNDNQLTLKLSQKLLSCDDKTIRDIVNKIDIKKIVEILNILFKVDKYKQEIEYLKKISYMFDEIKKNNNYKDFFKKILFTSNNTLDRELERQLNEDCLFNFLKFTKLGLNLFLDLLDGDVENLNLNNLNPIILSLNTNNVEALQYFLDEEIDYDHINKLYISYRDLDSDKETTKNILGYYLQYSLQNNSDNFVEGQSVALLLLDRGAYGTSFVSKTKITTDKQLYLYFLVGGILREDIIKLLPNMKKSLFIEARKKYPHYYYEISRLEDNYHMRNNDIIEKLSLTSKDVDVNIESDAEDDNQDDNKELTLKSLSERTLISREGIKQLKKQYYKDNKKSLTRNKFVEYVVNHIIKPNNVEEKHVLKAILYGLISKDDDFNN